MAVTNAQIRDLLNRPRGLNDATITEYLTIRTNFIDKIARSTTLYEIGSANAITSALKDDAVKFLTAIDCLRVMVDTIPSYVPENKQRQQDIRLRTQLSSFEKQAQASLDLIAEAGGTAFYITQTQSRQDYEP